MTTTRATLRRRVGDLTGDLLLLTATQAGDTTTLKDEVTLAVDTDTLIGRDAWFAEGTASNLYVSRRVNGNNKLATSVTFGVALPAATAIGDVVELYGRLDQGVTAAEIHRQINYAITSVGEVALSPTLLTSAANFDANDAVTSLSGVTTITWVRFTGADWQDASGYWHPIPPADLRVDEASRSVEVRNRSRWLANGNPIRFRGATVPAELTADTDTTQIDAEWLAHEAAAACCFGVALRTTQPDRWERRAQYLQGKADSLRQKVVRLHAGKRID